MNIEQTSTLLVAEIVTHCSLNYDELSNMLKESKRARFAVVTVYMSVFGD